MQYSVLQHQAFNSCYSTIHHMADTKAAAGLALWNTQTTHLEQRGPADLHLNHRGEGLATEVLNFSKPIYADLVFVVTRLSGRLAWHRVLVHFIENRDGDQPCLSCDDDTRQRHNKAERSIDCAVMQSMCLGHMGAELIYLPHCCNTVWAGTAEKGESLLLYVKKMLQ